MGSVVPAHAALLQFFREEYLPQARDTLAAEAMPDGKAWYRQQIREYTTLDLDPEAIHRIGLDEVARIQAEMDAIIDQESGARAVYTNEADPAVITCYALVGDTLFGQAMSAVFTGLSKPQVPTNIFRTLDDAMPWIDQMNRSRGGTL